MYIYYIIGNNSGPQTLVRIVEVSVIGGVRFRRFHCICLVKTEGGFKHMLARILSSASKKKLAKVGTNCYR